MITNLISMNGYGLYVWSSFAFTFISFTTLYHITKIQYTKEKNKFMFKFGALDSKTAEIARSQTINKEILSSSQNI
jgi:heme exporter protein D